MQNAPKQAPKPRSRIELKKHIEALTLSAVITRSSRHYFPASDGLADDEGDVHEDRAQFFEN